MSEVLRVADDNTGNDRLDRDGRASMWWRFSVWCVVCSGRVYLVGSLAAPETAHHASDIVLVVEGLAPHDYFKTLAELWRLLPRGVELDPIPYEDAAPELKERARREGVTLDA